MPDTAATSKTRPDPPPALRSDPRPSRGATILLVDPDQGSRDRTRRMLVDDGYRVVATGRIDEAEDALDDVTPEVVVIDHDALATHDAGRLGHAFPVVLVIAPGLDSDELARLDVRIDACLVKPLRPTELLARIAAAVKARRRELAEMGLRELRGEQARMWTVLLDFSRSMGRALALEEVIERLVLVAAQMTCSRRVSLMLPDETHETLRIVKAIGIDEEAIANVRLPIGDAVAGRAFASGRTMMTGADGTTHPAQEGVYESDTFVSMPIRASSRARQESVGVLNITNRINDRPFEEWELEFIDLLGGIAGSIIDDATWREARESILKFERDLQVARRIQQNTFPRRLPAVAGFDIAAWSEPAEETGGDSYDVIGFRANTEGVIELTEDDPTHAVLLLADATGHGIGPALSVTQVRAMVRMAVRLRADLSSIVRHLNEQLAADLPRGRFITAWFGEIDATAGTLAMFSAGQGPVLHYDAGRRALRSVPADAAPLGIVPDLVIPRPVPHRLGAGDVVAVISDGVVEATNAEGTEFGVGGVEAVIRAHHAEAGPDILRRLQEHLAAFGGSERRADDRTALIVKRHG